MALVFKVEGSKGDIYTVTANLSGHGNLTILCTCAAGQNGIYCKHRFGLLDGDDSSMVSPNVDDIFLLQEMVEGTDVETWRLRVGELQQEADTITAELRKAKKALALAMRD